MAGSVKIEGLSEMNKALKKLDAKVATKISRAGLAEAAKVMRKEMRARAPRDSGNLRKNIKYKLKRFQRRGYKGSVGVMSKAFYASFIEYGSSPHKIKGVAIEGKPFASVDHPGIEAKPFLRPAFEAKKEAAIKAIGPKVWAMIKKEAKKKA